ncbi:unnamed protein product [Didymodactylos carnosus]|uniref:Uncharacterized protein n=1 Tax=Didymodactylos carnosus TaxID=1234261 RepID=A0A815V2E7_9BILA|nr:unnamed protein product [Didymodactylos carnosus]CAF4389639.1 unnamed protein product [Didymodactylos carnosus]
MTGVENLVNPRKKLPSLDVDSALVNSLRDMYVDYEKQGLPYQEKIRILSLLPNDGEYEQIMNKFGCIRHRRIGPSLTEPFISWLIETDMMVSVPWGYSQLKLDTGEKLSIPKQIIQAKKSHVILQYKQHCLQNNFTPLSDRTLFYVLDNLNVKEQKSLSGMDDFVKGARDGWLLLENIMKKLNISPKE